MTPRRFSSLCLFLAATLGAVPGEAPPAGKSPPVIGESEQVYTLAPDNTEVRGVAIDEVSPHAPRLFVLDRSGTVFSYKIPPEEPAAADTLELLSTLTLPFASGGSTPASLRGLAFTVQGGKDVLYFANWSDTRDEVTSQLWRYPIGGSASVCAELSLYPFRIGDREILDIAYDNGAILVCFDPSGYLDRDVRVRRGILRLRRSAADAEQLEFAKHLPDSGHLPSRGIATMELEGARYLWATVGNEYIYCADAPGGRGLFHFDRPRSSTGESSLWGLAFGRGALWVPEDVPGPDRVHRVNVTQNLDAPVTGPRILRRVVMEIQTEPEAGVTEPGRVYHYYSRPYAADQMPCQGIWPETERVSDLSAAPNAAITHLTYDPAGDVSSRQHLRVVTYGEAPAKPYSSRYEIDLWTNPCRTFVYPHRADRQTGALEGTAYLADDPALFNLGDRATYDAFFDRVRAHIEKKYGVAADLENPYWAARNVLEYLQDSYYYPSRPKRKPAAVDYDRGHYDANPGNLKIELSGRPYDKTQIIACSGTSVMLAGAMRYLGIPARWLGTGTERDPEVWDTNSNGLLEASETAPCTNGHRYTQVWLGSSYGWICFDATPSRPEFDDFDPPPPLQPQWRYMDRAAAGHRRDKRIVFNVGSGLFRPLYRDFEYDEERAPDNDCGGDQRYNLQGRFDRPEAWKLAGNRITVQNLCFIEDVALDGPRETTCVSWKLAGAWDRDPAARVSIDLQRIGAGTASGPKDVKRLAENLPAPCQAATVDLSDCHGKGLRVIVRKVGDPETGGTSPVFALD